MKYRDNDYIFGNALIHALENSLIDYDKLMRIAQASGVNDALRILSECGYPDVPGGLDARINAKRREVFCAVETACPENNITEFFRIRYYCNNIKAVVKGEFSGRDYADLITDVGGIDSRDIAAFVKDELNGNRGSLPDWICECALSARDALKASNDAAAADLIIERAGFAAMLECAKNSESAFLTDYCRLLIDSVNLKTAVRLAVTGRASRQYLEQSVIPGGSIEFSELPDNGSILDFIEMYEKTSLSPAVNAAKDAANGKGSFSDVTEITEREKWDFLAQAKNVTFGEHPIIAYVASYEAEFIAVHAVMSCIASGISTDSVMERLRWHYV